MRHPHKKRRKAKKARKRGKWLKNWRRFEAAMLNAGVCGASAEYDHEGRLVRETYCSQIPGRPDEEVVIYYPRFSQKNR